MTKNNNKDNNRDKIIKGMIAECITPGMALRAIDTPSWTVGPQGDFVAVERAHKYKVFNNDSDATVFASLDESNKLELTLAERICTVVPRNKVTKRVGEMTKFDMNSPNSFSEIKEYLRDLLWWEQQK